MNYNTDMIYGGELAALVSYEVRFHIWDRLYLKPFGGPDIKHHAVLEVLKPQWNSIWSVWGPCIQAVENECRDY